MKKLTWFAVLLVVALAVLNIAYQPETTADAVYPMTNQRIEWQ
jgi:hypothetical protein